MTIEAWVKPTALTELALGGAEGAGVGSLPYALYANTDVDQPAASVFTTAPR